MSECDEQVGSAGRMAPVPRPGETDVGHQGGQSVIARRRSRRRLPVKVARVAAPLSIWWAISALASPPPGVVPRMVQPPEGAVESARQVHDWLEGAAAAQRRAWPGLALKRPVVIASDSFSLLFDAAPLEGFIPLEGRACPCWRPEGSRIGPRRNARVWIFSNHRAWRPWSEDETASFAAKPDALVALVVPWVADPGAVRVDLLVSLFRMAVSGSPLEDSGPALLARLRSSRPDAAAVGSDLLKERRWLADALRSPPGTPQRWRAIWNWQAERHLLRDEGVIDRLVEASERRAGLEWLFYLDATEGEGNARDRELRLAGALEAEPRDLWPEAWFGQRRSMETGLAMLLLIEDLAPRTMHTGGRYFRVQKIDRLLGGTSTWIRRPGLEREALMSSMEVRARIGEPPPPFRPFAAVDFDASLRELEGQARAVVRTKLGDGRGGDVLFDRAWGIGAESIVIGEVTLWNETDALVWNGLAAADSSPGNPWIDLFAFSGRGASGGRPDNLSLPPGAKLTNGPGNRWTLELPRAEAR